MYKEEYKLIDLGGINTKRQKEYCLVCTQDDVTAKVFVVVYPSFHRLLNKYKYFKKINFN